MVSNVNKSFISNVTVLIGSNIAAQLLSVFGSFVEARLYTPLEMGVYSTYIAVLAVFTVVVCFQYERAIVLTQDYNEAEELIRLCIYIVTAFVALLSVFTVFFSYDVAESLNASAFSNWFWLLPVSVFVAGILAIMMYWNIKNANMKRIATANIITVVVANTLQILFGFEKIHLAGGMILGHLIGNAAAVGYYVYQSGFKFICRYRISKKLLLRFRQFPLFSVPAAFFDTLGSNLPNLLLANFFGAAATGYYAVGYRLLSMPASVITGAAGQAYLSAATEAFRKDDLAETTKNIFEFLLKVALVPLTLVAIVSKSLIFVVLGTVWLPAASFIPYLCFTVFLGLLYSPISNLLIVLEKQKDGLVIQVLTFFVKVCTLCLSGFYGNALLAVATCSFGTGIIALIGCFYIMRLAQVKLCDVIGLILKYLLRTLLFVIPTCAVIYVTSNAFIQVAVAILNGLFFLVVSGNEIFFVLKKR